MSLELDVHPNDELFVVSISRSLPGMVGVVDGGGFGPTKVVHILGSQTGAINLPRLCRCQ
jgi:hypothetical protein